MSQVSAGTTIQQLSLMIFPPTGENNECQRELLVVVALLNADKYYLIQSGNGLDTIATNYSETSKLVFSFPT